MSGFGSLAWDPGFGIPGFGLLALASDRWLGILGLVYLAWDLWLGEPAGGIPGLAFQKP